MAADNITLGHFRLDGLPPSPRGVPQVEVTFDIDANGILNVTAKDKATGREQKVTITASTNLSKDEIERKVRDAQQHESEDKRRRELIEARNQGDNLAYQTEKTLRELGDKVPANDRSNIESKVSELREALKGEDTPRIKKLSEELQQAFYAISQQLYQQGAPNPATPGSGMPGGNGHGTNGGSEQGPEDEGVVEGQFHEA
jgi:molecular chaperone DnaK